MRPMNQWKRLIVSLALVLSVSLFLVQPPQAFGEYTSMEVQAATVKLNKNSAILSVGETVKLKIKGSTEAVTWNCEDKNIIKINKKGRVKALSQGEALVSASVGNKIYFCSVTVADKSPMTAQEVYQECADSVVKIQTYNEYGKALSQGSGFFIDDGILVTNYHVVQDADTIQITTSEGEVYKGKKILAKDEEVDVAVLSVNITGNTYLKKGNLPPVTGDSIYIIGCPMGLIGTLTSGIVSYVDREVEGNTYIQIDAAVSAGSSGGPLLNEYGEVIGIVTAQYQSAQNLNFALKISEITNLGY